MKKLTLFAAALLIALPGAGWASTTVTIDGSRVIVTPEPTRQVIEIQPRGSQTVFIQKEYTVTSAVVDPAWLEGQVTKVDVTAYQVTVRDIDGRERRINLKQGMINNQKVGDYVRIQLTPDLKDAMMVRVQTDADIEGEVVRIDRNLNQVVLRQRNGAERVIVLRSTMLDNYKVGDTLRLYVVSDYSDVTEVNVIRVS